MSARAVDPQRSRIVLVGTPAYTDPGLPDVPVVANNVTDLAAVLTDAELGGFDPRHCAVAPSTASVEQVGDLLVQAAEEAEDLLLFYYSGHGLLGPRRRDLYLSLAGTRPGRLAFTALPFDAVRDACLGSRAASRVVILDSCFSGRAIGDTLADDAVLGQLEVAGTYTLTSAPANRTALILPGERHTAFTERLLHLLRTGTPAAGPLLSLGDIYRHLHARLRSEGLPEPQQRGTATADLLGLARNRRFGATADTTLGAPPAVDLAKLLEGLHAGLDSRYPRPRAAAVEELADWLTLGGPGRVQAARIALERAAANGLPVVAQTARAALGRHSCSLPAPDRSAAAPALPPDRLGAVRHHQGAAVVLATAERVAGSITDESSRARALAGIAKAWAGTDPDQAERVAGSIADDSRKTEALAGIAASLAGTDPDRAERLSGEAERVAGNIGDGSRKAQALTGIARALAGVDPDRAERVAAGIIANAKKAQALAAIAGALAGTDPDRAERVARSITAESMKAQALAGVARALAWTDPDRAEWVARSITDDSRKAQALAAIVRALAGTDPDRVERLSGEAERVAGRVSSESYRAEALTAITRALAGVDPDRAEWVAGSIADGPRRREALAAVARALAGVDPDRAERVAGSITDDYHKAWTLAAIAEPLAGTDPDRAERLSGEAERVAGSIADGSRRAQALAGIAKLLAATDPDGAERVAGSIADEYHRAQALVGIATVWMGGD
ncbi:caspase family protein [Kitasatospora sp. NPDC127116]|uniref:caspase, EACC1-associated type n=1 Tax=Kitasatospora sp. NPDC127116 TaxID=3345367 RepID=UPI00363DAAD4